MTERCRALVKLALEPEWEARFEPNSYGFRPGRSCHDAIEAIYSSIKQKAKFVLDADIAKCFDRIDHKALLGKLNTFPTIRRQVRAWLKAGVMDRTQLFPTSEAGENLVKLGQPSSALMSRFLTRGLFKGCPSFTGLFATGTPQGGVISPLLANIALHGMEERIEQYADTFKGRKESNRKSLSLIRYADDFVILHKDITVVQRCREIISEWLKDMGLELKPAKTRLTHTLEGYGIEKPGFDFLGFHIRQFKVGKYHSGKSTHSEVLGFKTIITPSKEKQKIHYDRVASIIDDHKGAPQVALIGHLNPIIRGYNVTRHKCATFIIVNVSHPNSGWV